MKFRSWVENAVIKKSTLPPFLKTKPKTATPLYDHLKISTINLCYDSLGIEIITQIIDPTQKNPNARKFINRILDSKDDLIKNSQGKNIILFLYKFGEDEDKREIFEFVELNISELIFDKFASKVLMEIIDLGKDDSERIRLLKPFLENETGEFHGPLGIPLGPLGTNKTILDASIHEFAHFPILKFLSHIEMGRLFSTFNTKVIELADNCFGEQVLSKILTSSNTADIHPLKITLITNFSNLATRNFGYSIITKLIKNLPGNERDYHMININKQACNDIIRLCTTESGSKSLRTLFKLSDDKYRMVLD